MRNPLNGLAISLEVVRSRAARGGVDVSSVSQFAVSAASELERAAELVQALLELARPVAAPVDLWSALRPMVVLHHALAGATAAAAGVVASGEGEGNETLPASVTLLPHGSAALTVATDPHTARAALASTLDAVANARVPARVSCTVEARGGGDVVALLHSRGATPRLDDRVRGIIEDGGVRLETLPDGMTLFFRAAGRE